MDAEAKKMLAAIWASGEGADRESPADVGITRARGWGVAYEQVGSGLEPERTIFNQKFREVEGAFQEKMRMGGCMRWDQDVNYFQYARVIGSDGNKYWCQVATGPAHGNIQDPTLDTAQSVWRLY